MRPTTIVLQCICVVLGTAFIVSAFTLADHVLVGGLLLGSLMGMSAAFLGADHTTNLGSQASRHVFKVLAVIASLPLLGVGFQSAATSAIQGNWGTAIFTSLKLLVVVAALVFLAFDTNPKMQRFLHRIGLSSPPPENENNRTL